MNLASLVIYSLNNEIFNAQKSFWRTNNFTYETKMYSLEDYPYHTPKESHRFKPDSTNWYFLEAENCGGYTSADSIYVKLHNVADTQ